MATSLQALDFQQVRTRRVFEEICDQIRHRLGSGVLRPGDKLPAERDLAQEFKVSRPAVREALRTLEISGVVSLQKGVKGGAFIRDGNPALLTQSLQDLVFLGRVSLRSLVEARVRILRLVIELACERGTEEDFRKIDENIDHIASSDDLQHRAEVGAQFFRLIAQATRNEVLTMLVDSLGDIVRYVIDRTGRRMWPELVPVRRNILKSMRARNAAAAMKFMQQYLNVVHEAMDAEPIALHRPGRTPAAALVPRAPAAKVKAKTKATPAKAATARTGATARTAKTAGTVGTAKTAKTARTARTAKTGATMPSRPALKKVAG